MLPADIQAFIDVFNTKPSKVEISDNLLSIAFDPSYPEASDVFSNRQDASSVIDQFTSVQDIPDLDYDVLDYASKLKATAIEYLNHLNEQSVPISTTIDSIDVSSPSSFETLVLYHRLSSDKYTIKDLQSLMTKINGIIPNFIDLPRLNQQCLCSLFEALRSFVLTPESLATTIYPWLTTITDQVPQVTSEEGVASFKEILAGFCDGISTDKKLVKNFVEKTVEMITSNMSNHSVVEILLDCLINFPTTFGAHPRSGQVIVDVLSCPEVYVSRNNELSTVLNPALDLVSKVYEGTPKGFTPKAFDDLFVDTNDLAREREYSRGLLAFATTLLDLGQFKSYSERLLVAIRSNSLIYILAKSSITAGYSKRHAPATVLVQLISELEGQLKGLSSTAGTFSFVSSMVILTLSHQKHVVTSLKKSVFSLLKAMHKLSEQFEFEDVQSAVDDIIDYLENRIDLPQDILDLRTEPSTDDEDEEEEELEEEED
ncbi:hypothetical protein RCL1_006877 [Eukaryota sp. TZLM3-RCL]